MKEIMLKNKLGDVLTILALVMVMITITSGFIASAVRVNADDITDVADITSITVQSSCSMTSTIDTAHNAIIPNGIYSGGSDYYPNGIGKTTIATFCNDNSGYAIYAIGFTSDKYDGEDHTKLIGQTTGEKIATGTAQNGNTSNWAMKLTKVTDSTKSYNPEALSIEGGYDAYSAIPDTYTKVANYTSTTDRTLGSVLETTYAAYISSAQPADTYVGKVKYTLVHPNTEIPLHPETTGAGKICYYPNGSAVVGTMGCQTIPASGTSNGVSPTFATLLASNFSRIGYGFAGWNTEYDYTGTFYGPNESISYTTSQFTGTNPGLSLYAVWVRSAGSLQDSSKVAELCGTGTGSLTQAPIDGTANLSSVSALTDQRDNNTYAIAKLADGKCWMIENMRLDNTNSDNSIGTLAQGYGTTATFGNFAGLADPEAPWANSSTTANSLYSTDGANNTIKIGTSNASSRFPRYNNQNIASRADTITTNNNNIYSYGNYYTWAGAIADIRGYSISDIAITTICPKGWILPTGKTSTGGFGNLDIAIGGTGATQNSAQASNRWRKFPNSFLLSGMISDESFGSRGNDGNYWSSLSYSQDEAYFLGFGRPNNAYPGNRGEKKYYGFSVRCLAQ